MSEAIDLLNCCDICGEGHTTEQCPELVGIPIDPNLGDYMTRARLTLPNCLEAIDQRIGYNGVFAKELIPAKTQLGPFEAKRTTHIFDDTGFFTLKLVTKSGSTVCLDTTDENECNWLCLVRPAVSQEAQNCMAYQLGSNIFYSTTEDVMPGVELQVWYTSTYARKIGKSVTPDGVSKALLGHKIVPIQTDIPLDPSTENIPDGQDKQQQQLQDQTDTNEVVDDTNANMVHAEIRGEIQMACHCPRCGEGFISQSCMVRHLRGHIISNGSTLSPKKRGRGRPRIHPIGFQTEASTLKIPSKRSRGRPRKNKIDYADQNQQLVPKSVPSENIETSEALDKDIENADEEYDEVINGEADYDLDEDSRALKRFRVDEEVDDSVNDDKDYAPLLEVKSPGRRIQPGRSRKGKNTHLMQDYIVGKVVKMYDKVSIDNPVSVNDNQAQSVGTECAEGQIVKRKRGRPRKIDLVKKEYNGKNNSMSITDDKECSDLDEEHSLERSNQETAISNNLRYDDVSLKETANEFEENSNKQALKKANQEIIMTSSCEVLNNEIGDTSTKEFENDNTSVTEGKIYKENSNETEPGRYNLDNLGHDTSMRTCQQTDLVPSLDNITYDLVKNDKQISEAKAKHNNKDSKLEENKNQNFATGLNKSEQDYVTDEISQISSTVQDLIEHSNFNHLEATNKDVTKISIPEDPHREEQKELLQAASTSHCPQGFFTENELNENKNNYRLESNKDQENIENTYKPNKDGPHICDICKQEFKTAMYLYRHMVMHTDIFRCIQCKKTFSRKDSMQKHVLKCCPEKAESLKILHCEKCMRVFSTANGKRKHVAKCDLVICEKCKCRFSSREDLAEHVCQNDAEKGAYSCGKCSKSFQSLHYLKQHSLIHKNLHTCLRCNKSLPTKDDLERHSMSCETLDSIKLMGQGRCQRCNEVFNSAKQFREHVLTHTHPFQCEHCQRRFIKVGTLSNHECLHTAELKACNVCSKQFKSQEERDQHINHHECLKYKCSACQKQFYMKADARNHECDLDVQVEERKILYAPDCTEMCPVCGKSFASKSNLQKHLTLHGEKKLKCPHCDKKFHLQVYLREHINSFHFQLSKFQCLSCGKMFKSKSGLNMHNSLFHNMNPPSYRCPKCFKEFFSKGYLTVHMYKHSTERRFKCQVCSKVFKYPDQLSRHRAEHNPDEKYSCIYCEKQFSLKYSLKRHLQIYHSGYVYICGICSAKCCHKHTLLRHYKRKHTDSLDLLNEKGYVRSLLKHVSTLPGYKPEDSEENPVTDYNQEVNILPEETVQALTSLSMGTCTTEEYQILKDRGLIKADEVDPQFGLPINQTLIVSDDGQLISTQKQVMIPQEQLLPQNDSIVTGVNEQIGLIQNPDGTINISDIQGLPQTLETLDSKDGQIVILQIVEASDQVTQALNHGEVLQQLPEVTSVLEGESKTEQNLGDVVSDGSIQIVSLPEGLRVTTGEVGILGVDTLINQQTGSSVRQNDEDILHEVNLTNGEAVITARQNDDEDMQEVNLTNEDTDIIINQNDAAVLQEVNLSNEVDMAVRHDDVETL